jgi:pentose-5-phosphate-3-epimerase
MFVFYHTQVFKDEYLLDYINVETSDERVIEKRIVNNIKEFIMKMGKVFRLSTSLQRLQQILQSIQFNFV